MKPKPFSIQHRIILIQASVFALAMWFLAGTLYVNLRIERELKESLRALETELRLHTELSATLVSLRELGHAEMSRSGGPLAGELESVLETLARAVREYARLGPGGPDARWREAVEQAARALAEATRAVRAGGGSVRSTERSERAQRAELLYNRLEMLIHSRMYEQVNQLADSRGRLEEYTLTLTLLFLAIALIGTLALLNSRRVMRREIWEPLEELRRMEREVRGGNLAIYGAVPASVELGAPLRGFLEMAGALRAARESLEEKVKERTASLERAQRELVQSAKLSSLGLMISGVAHEINNPLTSILGFSELALARPGLEARLRSALESIREEALRLRSMVSNLSTFARRGAFRAERLDLRQVLDRVVELRRYQLRAANIELHYNRPEQPVWIKGDADQLLQVFFNLVHNAEQAIAGHATQGEIWLACGTSGRQVWSTVRDTGSGIAPEILDSIFDPFFTTKPVGQGTGLGLSISHGIIQRHGGAIEVESAVGRGTTMRVTLPVARAELAEPAEGPPNGTRVTPERELALPPAAPRAGGWRALVLDDEPLIVEFVKEGLAACGWIAEGRTSALGLENLLREGEFDLILCDLKMPGRNGVEVLRLLRNEWPRLAGRFLVMTGNCANSDMAEGAELAGIPVLRKPFSLAQLAESLRQFPHEPG
jgi:signal transduction histidine kinase/CheY-like chemotaxis protein